MKHTEAIIEGEFWTATHAPERQEPFTLSIDGEDEQLILDGVSLGSLNERDALTEKVIKHEYMEGAGCAVETESIIPFGVEPIISRKFEYYLNTVRITTDVSVRAGVNTVDFNIDDLHLCGNWSRFAVVVPDEHGDFPKTLPWVDIATSATNALWESSETFAFILLESKDGKRLEIGSGFDLWRWDVASTMNSQGVFALNKTVDGGVRLKRSVLRFESETSITAREWRFNWYLAWDMGSTQENEINSNSEIHTFPKPGEKVRKTIDGEKDLQFTLKKTSWPDHALVMKSGVLTTQACCHSKSVRNHLRKTIRSIAATASDSLATITIYDWEPHYCEASPHLERSKQAIRPHWDMADIIAFHFWASRQLGKKDVILKILAPVEGIFHVLPSFTSMK